MFFTFYTFESQATKRIHINNTHSEHSPAVRRQTFESSSDMRSSVILKFPVCNNPRSNMRN